MRALLPATALALLLGTVAAAPVAAASGPCRVLGLAGLDRALPSCGLEAAARLSIAAGQRALADDDLAGALARFREATAHAPARSDAHILRGAVAETLGELDEAYAAYEAAVRLDPSPAHHVVLGALADRLGHVDPALRAL